MFSLPTCVPLKGSSLRNSLGYSFDFRAFLSCQISVYLALIGLNFRQIELFFSVRSTTCVFHEDYTTRKLHKLPATMLPVRLVLLLLVSLALYNVSGGDSNDQMDAILSEIVNMNKRMSAVTSDVGGIKTDVGGLKTDVVKIEDEMKKMKNQTGEMNTRLERYPFGWVFHGREVEGNRTDHIGTYPVTFSYCVQMCNLKRTTDGAARNGMIWSASDGWCQCSKNDQGHKTDGYDGWIHFKTQ